MGWAARANPLAELKRTRQLAPLEKKARPRSKHGDVEKMWAAFLARLASTPKKASAA